MPRKPKIATVRVTHYYPGRPDMVHDWTGTLDELIDEVFGYTLECGQAAGKFSGRPKSFKSLVSKLQKADDYIHGCCYSRDFYELVEK